MTRKECEKKLLALAEQMRAVYMEYNPSGDFLSMIADDGGYICVDDCYFNADRQIIQNVNGDSFQTVTVRKYSDGHIHYGNCEREEENIA